jgi:ceramide glucosyltransferase
LRISKVLFVAGCFGLLTSTAYTILVCAGARRYLAGRRFRRSGLDTLPPVSLFKPVHGTEPGLDAQLASFFEQDYPSFEILFCAGTAEDAGLAVARAVAARYPAVPTRCFSIDAPTYVNAKVSSLERMHSEAAHDIFVVSDSDVRVTPEYLREVVAPFADLAVGGVTCLYRGVAGEGLWGQLEAAGMSVEMTSGVLVANLLEGMGFMLGPTMAVRREALEALGGFAPLGDYCSDDFLLGAGVAGLGRQVVLSAHVIDHIVLNLTLPTSIKHQVRWMRSTRFSRPLGHLGTALTFSVPYAMLAAVGGAGLGRTLLGLALGIYGVAARMAMAGLVSFRVVEDRAPLRTVLLYPLRDLMGFFFWAASYASSKVLWRGRVYRLREQGRMERVL